MLTKDLLGLGEQIHGCDACACVCCELRHFPDPMKSSEIASPLN